MGRLKIGKSFVGNLWEDGTGECWIFVFLGVGASAPRVDLGLLVLYLRLLRRDISL